jgi:hypothetical protein
MEYFFQVLLSLCLILWMVCCQNDQLTADRYVVSGRHYVSIRDGIAEVALGETVDKLNTALEVRQSARHLYVFVPE